MSDTEPRYATTPWGTPAPGGAVIDPVLHRLTEILHARGELSDAQLEELLGIGTTAVPSAGPIPDVVDGEIIEAAWGNEIRNRTITPFADVASLKAWAAPNGSTAWVTATKQFYWRRDGAWWTENVLTVTNAVLSASGTYGVTAAALGLATIFDGRGQANFSTVGPPQSAFSTFRLEGPDRAFTQITIRCVGINGTAISLPTANTTMWATAKGPIA